MKIDLSGKVALITGSSCGIGFSVASGLLAAGANVIINGRSQERIAEAMSRLDDAKRVSGIVADVGTLSGCNTLTTSVSKVDILVNNAGFFRPRPLLEISDSEWLEMMEVNVMSGIRLTRYYLHSMMQRRWGRVIFVSSESALQIPSEMVHYGVSKMTQLAVARGFAEIAINTGVTVNSVLPGPTMSEGVENFVQNLMGEAGTAEEAGLLFMKKYRPSSLLGRLTTTDEVANFIVYLSSMQSSAITGAALRVDGGVLRSVI
ncbi:SDR family NAD(P)-dependent oxidoreductase [Xenorhabdus kozodoii]|uniref:3-ketoacyl-ACP reductase n=1 Tax=Xenorhabdus kozodoii TaxID=351676 RepID=A0A2D0LCW3_9GAMM|nr:SDR family NAD(P)-dependent oxidoreductase [Xenorhabdus kozodoii]PHM73257.1 3-ketoacyl-ACP reductase [Xenorhabdus kozodoii]